MSKRQKLIITACGIIVLLAGLIYWASRPSKGTITTSYATKPLPTDKVLDGKYMKLTYSSRYTVSKVDSKADTDLEVYRLHADTTYDKRLSVSVTQPKGGQLSDDGSYILRKAHPEQYAEQIRQINGRAVTVMTKSDSNEQTVFMLHGTKLATLSFVTDSAADEHFSDEVTAVATSLTWK